MFGKQAPEIPEEGNESLPFRLLYSVPETAQLLGGISDRHVYRLIARSELKATQIGRRTLVHRDEIARYIGQLSTTAAA